MNHPAPAITVTETLAPGVPINLIEMHLYCIRKSVALVEMLLSDADDHNEIPYPLANLAGVLSSVEFQLDTVEKLCNHAYFTSTPQATPGGEA